ncbi:MAG: 50S ribosomal protein L29 [Candidatus Omnitrophota bacterium]
MKIDDLRNMSKDDLLVKLASIKEELGKLNYQKVIGQIEKPHQFKMLKKTIARIKTLLNEKEMSSVEKE